MPDGVFVAGDDSHGQSGVTVLIRQHAAKLAERRTGTVAARAEHELDA